MVRLGRRGGFCYELNGLFGWLLREIGFDASSKRVA
jgi:N-hydroxyarylamine O-acetyltransferase